MSKLDTVKVGSKIKVAGLLSTGALRERMLALGLTKGATVEVIRKGPTGDPTLYYLRGTMIALRKEEASLIQISEL